MPTAAAVSSVDPSSTTITSKSANVCFTSDSSDGTIVSARLNVGTITEKRGVDVLVATANRCY